MKIYGGSLHYCLRIMNYDYVFVNLIILYLSKNNFLTKILSWKLTELNETIFHVWDMFVTWIAWLFLESKQEKNVEIISVESLRALVRVLYIIGLSD